MCSYDYKIAQLFEDVKRKKEKTLREECFSFVLFWRLYLWINMSNYIVADLRKGVKG